ncbi:hypothetical protein [Streptacidiphilus melanogenes]|uniref:hypothetical protein n=1 Tax=Streptacidiphilus melanogenes TaxID=411235 RepID=UPI0005A742AD|nr:hypothetical protein [Streptacidiphilus melanogenes]
MAVCISVTFPGATLDTYMAVLDALGMSVGDPGERPKGAVSHVAGADEHGLHVIDVWESRADFDAFMQASLAPALAKAGVTGQPQVDHFEVANMMAPE